jgi:hypothetical protein
MVNSTWTKICQEDEMENDLWWTSQYFQKLKVNCSMNIRIVAATSFFLTFACNQINERDAIKEKSIYFDLEGVNSFENYQIHNMRKGKNSSYQVSRYDSSHDYAIIRLYPEPKIEKNFNKDTINIAFVNTFRTLNCQYLEFRKNMVRLDFNIGDCNYVLYKNYYGKSINLPFDTTKSIKVENNWAYLKFEKPKN